MASANPASAVSPPRNRIVQEARQKIRTPDQVRNRNCVGRSAAALAMVSLRTT
jgi:hypothetical protein